MIKQSDLHIQEDIAMDDKKHLSVMLNEILEYLGPHPEGIFVDGTLGMGGHSKAILDIIGPKGLLIGIDRDEQSLKLAKENLHNYAHQCHFAHDDYRNIDVVLQGLNIKKVDGILLDVGLSSFQLDNPKRGFSIRNPGPLDMRMDQNGAISAFDLINSLSEKEINTILKDFGQERWHKRIARLIVQERSRNPIETTEELSKIVLRSMPVRSKREKIHPATRTFQAFRIAVNQELESLSTALDKAVELLNKGGRIGVISFHSLEDRIVKEKFKSFERAELTKNVFKKPLRASEEEVKLNPRSRSAKFRVAEKI